MTDDMMVRLGVNYLRSIGHYIEARSVHDLLEEVVRVYNQRKAEGLECNYQY